MALQDGPEAWGWAAATGVLWGFSYFFWRRVQATDGSAFSQPAADVVIVKPPNAATPNGT